MIGFDPGTQVTGFGVITRTRKPRCVDVGIIRPKKGEALEVRLNEIFSRALELIHEYKPVSVAVENPFVGRSAAAALTLGQARGVLLLAAVRCGVDVASYSPRSIKAAVVGRGAASKEQVAYMIQRLLGLREIPSPLDASDALAVAYCHVNHGYHVERQDAASVDVRRLAVSPDDVDAILQWKQGKKGRKGR